ncbi:MAG: DUF3039 domain-containing protein [Myxococcaceae bacterium]|nr:MAG: DUF3039 domain-containing protein [Myxococcaceae bacterium]
MTVTAHEHLRATTGEHDRFKHYVLAVDLRNALMWRTSIEALCGKRWHPDGDPNRYPMCPTCWSMANDED